MLSVWVMSYVERFFTKVIPDVLSTVFVPLCTILVMAPLSLVALAPVGAYLGDGIAALLMSLYNAGGFVTIIAMVALMVLQPFLVVAGMHMAILTFGLTAFAANGSEPYVIVCNLLSNFAIWGAALATAIRFKRPEDRGNSITSFVSGIIGGVTEPSLFGILIPHQRVFTCVCVANAVVGVLAALLRVQFMNLGTSSILCLFCFVSAEGTQNVLNAVICGGAGFAISFVLTFLFGLTKDEREGVEQA